MDRFEMCEKIVEYLGVEETLDELTAALSHYEAEDLFSFIAQNHEIPLFEDEDEEDEDEEDED